MHCRGTQERSHQCVGGELRAGALADSCHDRLLISQRATARLIGDFLKRGHKSTVRSSTDGLDGEQLAKVFGVRIPICTEHFPLVARPSPPKLRPQSVTETPATNPSLVAIS